MPGLSPGRVLTGLVLAAVGLFAAACADRDGEGAASDGVAPAARIAVDAIAVPVAPGGAILADAVLKISAPSGEELLHMRTPDPAESTVAEVQSVQWQTGGDAAQLPPGTSPQALCHLRVSGGEIVTGAGQAGRQANDTLVETLIPCGALDRGGPFAAQSGGDPLRLGMTSTAILEVLRLHAPLAEYGASAMSVLDSIAGSLLDDPQFDRDGDGAVSFVEFSHAPLSVTGALDVDRVYAAARAAAQAHFQSRPTRQPNIILILADDLGYGDVSSFWPEGDIATPAIDSIAANGLALTNFHVYPLCASTRASLLTGRFTRELSQRGRGGPARAGIPRWAVTLPEFLRQAGYRTAAFGKWHLSRKPGFRHHDQGFQRWLGFYGGATPYHFSEINKLPHWTFYHQDQPYTQDDGHTNDLLADQTLAFIEANQDAPFFVYLSFNKAHIPLWDGEAFDYSARSDWVDRSRRDFAGGNRKLDYIALVRHMDARIGDILARLRDLGLWEDTLVMFASDNGADVSLAESAADPVGSNGPFRGGKSSVYEGGLRVPFVVQWPGSLPAGRVVDEFTMLVDLWPTLREVAGYPVANGDSLAPAAGDSLLPLLLGDGSFPAASRREGYFSFFGLGSPGFALIAPPWKLIRRGRQQQALYNLEEDPQESTDLRAEFPDKASELSQRIDRFLARD